MSAHSLNETTSIYAIETVTNLFKKVYDIYIMY